ncbi:MAG: Gfo/Idh/MocA family oxidoreductase [Planctomycetaceae bacterium]|nr:Gfo/Idh/MocA family oxidoreductase [Planctomycetaceae bacterium]
MAKVRIGFVGVGFMGQKAHLQNYVTLDNCEVVALAEVRKETGKLVAARYGIPKVYEDHKAMFAAEKLDGIVASQPFDRHAVLMPELYSGAKFVFTEKPLAVTVGAAENLAAAAQRAGCTHMVGYHKRSDPAVMHAMSVIKDWKASGKMGALRYVRILMPAGDWVANGAIGVLNAGDAAPELKREVEGGWEASLPGMDKPTSQAYVSFVNYYIHQVNLMRHLLGESYNVTYAEKSGVLLAVESASGVAGTIEMTPYRTTIEWEESALVAFEKGYVMIRLPAPLAHTRAGTVEVYADPGDSTPVRSFPTMPWVHAMRQQAINFVDVIQGKMTPPCAAAEAVEDLKMARQYIKLRFGQ